LNWKMLVASILNYRVFYKDIELHICLIH
jgi:hypothetical protein